MRAARASILPLERVTENGSPVCSRAASLRMVPSASGRWNSPVEHGCRAKGAQSPGLGRKARLKGLEGEADLGGGSLRGHVQGFPFEVHQSLRVEAFQTLGRQAPVIPPRPQVVLRPPNEAKAQLVQPLTLRPDAALGRLEGTVGRQLKHPVAALTEPELQSPLQPTSEVAQPGDQFFSLCSDHLGRVSRSRGPNIGNEISNRKIDLVAHRRDYGNPGDVDGSGDLLLVEGPQVFHRSSAAPDNDEVYLGNSVEGLDASGNFLGGSLALHFGRKQQRGDRLATSAQRSQDVVNRRSGL